MNIDYERLRNDLIDYFGTAMVTVFPGAMLDIDKLESATNEELIDIALENGFDLNAYEQKCYRK